MISDTDRYPDEIERDIDRTRGRIDRNVDELNARLSPSGLVDEATQYLRDGGKAVGHGLGNVGEGISRVVRDNPIPSALICGGVAWLAVSAVRSRANETAQPSSGRNGPLSTGMNDGGEDVHGRRPMSTARGAVAHGAAGGTAGQADQAGLKDKLAGAAANVQDGIKDGAADAMARGRRVKDAVADRADVVRQRAAEYGSQAGETARDAFDRQPLLVGVLGLAVGAAIGLAIPHTRREDDAMGPYRDRLSERVKDYGREQVDRAERVADAAVSAARDELDGAEMQSQADGHENSANRMTDKVANAARAAAKAAKDEAKTVRKDT